MENQYYDIQRRTEIEKQERWIHYLCFEIIYNINNIKICM